MTEEKKNLEEGQVYSAVNQGGYVPTYDQWLNDKNNGGQGGAAYLNYINAQNNINAELDRQKTAAMTNYQLARSTYGAEGEAMRSAGLTGGHSDYLDSKAYASAMSNIASAEKTAADNKVKAEQELYKAYENINNTTTNTINKINSELSTYTADDLFGTVYNNSTLSQNDKDTIVQNWRKQQAVDGNFEALTKFNKLTGVSGEDTDIEQVKTAATDKTITDFFTNYTATTPIASDAAAVIDAYSSSNDFKSGNMDTFIKNLAKKYEDEGSGKAYETVRIYGLGTDLDDIGEYFNFRYKTGEKDDEGKDKEEWYRTEIVETYAPGSNMYKLLAAMAGDKKLVKIGEKVYVYANSGGKERWILTDEKIG